MRIVAISDTHGQHNWIKLPKGDVLIHAGDFTKRGSRLEIKEFSLWLEKQKEKFKYIIIVAGNHDFYFEQNREDAKTLLPEGIIYLEDSGIELDNVKFWGNPWSTKFHDWAFMKEDIDLGHSFSLIPDRTDVLITHGPPYSILDKTKSGEHVGSKTLLNKIKQQN